MRSPGRGFIIEHSNTPIHITNEYNDNVGSEGNFDEDENIHYT